MSPLHAGLAFIAGGILGASALTILFYTFTLIAIL